MNRQESIRIHLDWWGKCRTCRFYNGDRGALGLAPAGCMNEASPLHAETVTHEGHCGKWDTFDSDVAFGLMSLWERGVNTARVPLEDLERILAPT